MATRIKDLAVKTGEYTDKNGEKKARYENVGSLWDGDKGQFITLKRRLIPPVWRQRRARTKSSSAFSNCATTISSRRNRSANNGQRNRLRLMISMTGKRSRSDVTTIKLLRPH